jgi:hypothetical protein
MFASAFSATSRRGYGVPGGSNGQSRNWVEKNWDSLQHHPHSFLLWLTVSRGLVIEDNNNPFSPMDGSRVITDDVSPN